MSTDQHHARVAFVGAGPGDPGLLTMRAARLIENADAVIFDQICGERFVAPFVRDEVAPAFSCGDQSRRRLRRRGRAAHHREPREARRQDCEIRCSAA